MITVVTCDTEGVIQERQIEHDISTMQDLVGGGHFDIARVRLGAVKYDVFINDEGRILNMDPNPAFRREGLVGPIFVAQVDVATGDTVSIPADEIAQVIAALVARRDERP